MYLLGIKSVIRLTAILVLSLIVLECKVHDNSNPVENNKTKRQIDTTLCNDGTVYKYKDYFLENNLWGKGDINNYSQCISVREEGRDVLFGWVFDWPPNSGDNVKSYSEI